MDHHALSYLLHILSGRLLKVPQIDLDIAVGLAKLGGLGFPPNLRDGFFSTFAIKGISAENLSWATNSAVPILFSRRPAGRQHFRLF